MEGIVQTIREQKLRTGYIASITGSVVRSSMMVYDAHGEGAHTRLVELEGPMEVSGHGTFGIVDAPEQGSRPFAKPGYVHGDPYVHVHLTCTSATQTVLGHLWTGGTPIKSANHPVSHFTVFIVEVVGAELQVKCDAQTREQYHFITEVAVR